MADLNTINDLINYVLKVRKKAETHGKWLDSINCNVFNGFNAIFNALTLTAELLSYYNHVWSLSIIYPLPPEEIQRKRQENAKRTIEITKWAFVHTMSIIEYSLKTLFGQISSKCPEIENETEYLYLRKIIEKLKDAGYVDDKDWNSWRGLIDVRNVVVHRNAIPDKNCKHNICGIPVSFTKGQMLRGPLDFFVKLIECAIELYKRTLENLHTRNLL